MASTKALTNMFLGFALLALQLGRVRDLSIADGKRLIAALLALPDQLAEVLEQEDDVAEVAEVLAAAESLFFVGRVRGFPVAREGAQKFKEISYRHAEAYQTSELKHGPLALISTDVPTVAVVPDDELTDRNVARSPRDRRPRRAARGRHPRRRRPRRDRPAAASTCPAPSASSTRSCSPSRCRCSPTTPPCTSATTSTSPATSPSPSRWSSARPRGWSTARRPCHDASHGATDRLGPAAPAARGAGLAGGRGVRRRHRARHGRPARATSSPCPASRPTRRTRNPRASSAAAGSTTRCCWWCRARTAAGRASGWPSTDAAALPGARLITADDPGARSAATPDGPTSAVVVVYPAVAAGRRRRTPRPCPRLEKLVGSASGGGHRRHPDRRPGARRGRRR